MGRLLAALLWVTGAALRAAPGTPPADMALIPEGSFTMGCDAFGPEHGAPAHTVVLSAFWIDRREVSNAEYERRVQEHGRSVLSSCDDCPVTRVSWLEADAFCRQSRKSLPTEAQWERAAGALDGCSASWGAEEDFDPSLPQARGGLKLRDHTAPVGSYPSNRWGIFDMAGNVWEWTADWLGAYATAHWLRDPQGPSSGISKVRRGGAWSDDTIAMAAGYRDWSSPDSSAYNDVGFRCARGEP